MTHHRLDVNKAQKWLVDNRDTKFEWGVSDCCLVTCDFIEHMTGIDPAEKHRGHYKTELGAKKALIKYGTIEDGLDGLFPRVEFNQCQRSDIVLFNSELGATLGVKWSCGVLCVSEKGLVVNEVNPDDVIACWRITE